MPQAKHEPGQVQPTPTQEECDLAAIGRNPLEKEHDGSADDPHHPPPPDPPPVDPPADDPHPEQWAKKQKQAQAEQQARGGYQTREVTAQPRTPPATPRSE